MMIFMLRNKKKLLRCVLSCTSFWVLNVTLTEP